MWLGFKSSDVHIPVVLAFLILRKQPLVDGNNFGWLIKSKKTKQENKNEVKQKY